MRPAFGCSRKLMQRSIVLLPEPDEPITLMTSPRFAFSVTPLRTSLSPYCLCRLSTKRRGDRVFIRFLDGAGVRGLFGLVCRLSLFALTCPYLPCGRR